MAISNFSLRIDDEMRKKLKVVANYEARTMAGQITVLVRDCIKKFEQENGAIEVSPRKRK